MADQKRAEFEAWWECEYGNTLHCESAWRGWEASRAAPAVQGEPVGEVRLELGAPSSIFAELYSENLPALAPGTKLYTTPQPAEQEPAPDVAGLVEALESLIKGYVRLLEAGMDRITSLGGDCDPVSVMEQNDPWLRDARAALAPHRKQGGNP